MEDKSSRLISVAARLRGERERLGLSQSDLGRVGDVTRQTQSEYEAGKRSWTISYMLAVEAAGVDPVFVLTGRHGGDRLAPDESELVACMAAIAPDQRRALLTIAGGLAGRPGSRRLHASASTYHPEPASEPALPPTPALARMFEGLLQVADRSAPPDVLAHELATLLPTGLAQARDSLPGEDRRGAARSPREDDHASRQAPRT